MDERLRQALVAAWRAFPEEDRHPPATENELRAFEAEFGPIPPAFREYLAVCGGLVGGGGEWIDGLPELPDSHRQFRADSGFWTMRGVFVIGWDGGGNPFGIELSSGRLLVEDHDFGGIHEMAPSFHAMLARGLRQEAERHSSVDPPQSGRATELCRSATGGAVDRPRVYRPRRDQGWLIVGIAAVVLIVGLGFALRGHPDDAVGVCCFPPFAAVVASLGVAHLRTRVEVGPGGVAKRPRVPGGFTVGWPTVEWWSVVDLRREDAADTFSDRAVRFAVGWQRFEVRESEVHRPGFEPFLADVRAWAGCRERAEPDAAADGGGMTAFPVS